MNSYRHTQFGWMILGGLGLWLAVALPILLVGRPPFWTLLVMALVALVLLLFVTLTVRVDDRQIELRFGPGLIRRRVLLADVRSFAVVRNRWYYGWGIRIIPKGTLYNVAGLSAVDLHLKSGEHVRIGTDEPEALLAALRQVLGEPPPLSAAETVTEDRRARRFLLIMLSISATTVLLVGTMFMFHLRPPEVALSARELTVRSALYSERIPLDEITGFSLEPELPRILLRTNGFAAGRTLRGHFRVEGLGQGQLFIENGAPPYLVLKTRTSFLALNFKDPERTRSLHSELQGYLRRQ